MNRYRIISIIILILAAALGYFVYSTETDGNDGRFDFRLGLDLAGGTQLTYVADTTELPDSEVEDSMRSLRDVIEKRINVFGVSEPIIQIEEAGLAEEGSSQRLIVELPGVTDIDDAVRQIGETPVLEFRLQKDAGELPALDATSTATTTTADLFDATGLTGRQLEGSSLQFDQSSGEPVVTLQFNDEGAELFATLTRENVGRVLGIFLDGEPLSLPVIQQEIIGGQAIITGTFTPEEARELAGDLRFGALPVPIELAGTQTVGATLGAKALGAGVQAGIIGLILVGIFMVLWYRLPGVVAVFSLAIYTLIMLSIFKLVPVTLTSAGIAGFIISVGMAVDANILIFERMKEELREKKDIHDVINEGVKRAWLSIRDGNGSTLLTAIILFYATTSLVRGFALVLGIGVLISMLTAIFITRLFLHAVAPNNIVGKEALFKTGIGK
jgi:protein-export membrane protein SecD